MNDVLKRTKLANNLFAKIDPSSDRAKGCCGGIANIETGGNIYLRGNTAVDLKEFEFRMEGTTPQGKLAFLTINSPDVLGFQPDDGLEFHGTTIGDLDLPALWLVGVEWVESAGQYASRIDYTSFNPGAPIKNYIEANPTNLQGISATGGYGGFPPKENSGFLITPTTFSLQSIDTLGGDAVFLIITPTGVNSVGIPAHADDATAGGAGLVTGDWFINTGNLNALTVKT